MRTVLILVAFLFASSASAEQIPYNSKITMKVGQTVTLKGVRTRCNGTRAPRYFAIRGKFPKVNIGEFKDGGAGTVLSKSCGKEVPGRAVLFKATKKGRAEFELYKDTFVITVR